MTIMSREKPGSNRVVVTLSASVCHARSKKDEMCGLQRGEYVSSLEAAAKVCDDVTKPQSRHSVNRALVLCTAS